MRRTYRLFSEGERKITYTVSGQGPPLVLVHGLSGSRRWWKHNLPAFEPHYTVYRVELIGFGHARRQRPVPLRESARILARWMADTGLPRAHVIGHSMGGHVALHLAARHGEQVDRLVLVAATGLLRTSWWRGALELPLAALNTTLDFLPVLVTDSLRAGPLNLYHAANELLRDDARDLLEHIRAPTLVISGGRDNLVTPDLGQQLVSGVANAHHHTFPRAGHVVMWDSAREFNELVLDFLQEDPA